MKSRRQILFAHYTKLLQKAASWAGLFALLGTTLVASPAAAVTGAQMGARSVTPTTLKNSTTASYAFSFKVGTSGAIGSIKIEICDSPLESVACVASASAGINSNGANVAASTFPGGGFTGTNCTGGTWVTNGTQAGGTSGTFAKWKNTGAAMGTATSANACTFTAGSITNPAGNNQNYYLRLTTYSDTNNATEVDFGGFALQTAQDITVTASVQEQLEFCVGDNTLVSGCGTVGTGLVSLSTGTGCPVLSTANVCTGVSKMAASTNASSGYSITYNGGVFTGPSDTITATGTPGAVSTINSKQFGLAITTKSGLGSGAIAAVYDFSLSGSKYAYVTGSAQQIATAAAATAENIYTVTYAANVDATTKPGQYSATINYVCTGLF